MGSLGAGGQRERSTGTKSSGSPGAGREAQPGPRRGDHGETDKVQTRPGPNPWDHGETGRQCKLNQDQSQQVTGSTRVEEQTGGAKGKDGGNPKIYAPPVSKDAADRVPHPCRCVYGQTLRIKLHIVRPKLVRYAC